LRLPAAEFKPSIFNGVKQHPSGPVQSIELTHLHGAVVMLPERVIANS